MPDKLKEIREYFENSPYVGVRFRIDYLLRRLEAAEAALEASIGLYRGEVGAEEMQAAMDAWAQEQQKEAQRG